MDGSLKHVALKNGVKMPSIGLGTWQSPPGEVEAAVKLAIEAGYRHIDTAQIYENEAEIGESLQRCINDGLVTRGEMFITTKLAGINMRPEYVREATLKSMKDLKIDYIDLFLIHTPLAIKNLCTQPPTYWPQDESGQLKTDLDCDYLEAWKEMEKLVDEGLVKAIGLSNFNKSQVSRVYNNARIKPSNLQVECHAYFPQRDLAEHCHKLGISFAAYAPIGSPSRASVQRTDADNLVLLEDAVVKNLAAKYNRSPAQILLRNLLQRGLIVLPKSVNKERIIANAKLFDFELSSEDMTAIAELERKGKRLFEFFKIFGDSSYLSAHFPFHEELPVRD